MVSNILSSCDESPIDSEGGRAEGSLFSSYVISSHLRDAGYPEKSIASMNRCQENTGGYVMMYCNNCGFNEIAPIKHWCSLRTCPHCAKKRQRKIRRQYLNFLQGLTQTRMNFLYFLTISPRNYKNLNDGLKDIRKNFTKFLRLKYIKERILGSVYVIEAKQKEDSWNIHIHAMVYGRFLDNRIRGKCLDCGQNLLKFDYQTKKFRCSSRRCSSLNVVINQDSKLVTLWKKSSKGQEVNMHITRQSSASYTLNYMLKYITASKEDFNDARGLAEYIVATRKMRLISTTGMFYRKKLEIPPPLCYHCKSKLFFVTCYEVEPQLRMADKEFEDMMWRKKRGYGKSAPPPDPVIVINLDNYI